LRIFLGFIFLLVLLTLSGQEETFESGSLWEDVVTTGNGKLVIYWHPNNRFNENKRTVMDGVEQALLEAFIAYTEQKYRVKIEIEWRRLSSFNDVIYFVSNSNTGVFGASSISITPERKEILNFTPPHFPDIAVIVSNEQFQLAKTHGDFKEMFQGAVMVSIPNTTLEKKLLELNTDLNLNSTFVFVNTGGDVIGKIESLSNSLGYLDLANFMTAIQKNARLRRQYFYPVRLEGLSFAYPLTSDWDEPIDDYFSSSNFKVDRDRIISQYLGENVNDLIDRISKSAEIGPYEEIILLTEERESQAKELLASALREQQRQRLINWLFVGALVIIILLVIFYIRFLNKVRANEKLKLSQRLTESHNQQLLALNQEKNDLIKVLAHDLRNPINQLMGFSELLLKGTENLKGDQVAMLGFMKQSSEKLRDMIAKILDVDAIEAGNRNVVLEKLLAASIIENVHKQFVTVAADKEIHLLKDSESSVFVLADKVYLSQILENLTSNALKFSKANTSVKLSMFTTDNEVVFIVEDQGPGFTKKDQERIFKKYQQLSAKSTAGEASTGLGLSIVKMFAEMMNGSVTYETEEGVGTTFYVRLPRVK
jgi:signal transduction histidine kinase